MIHRIYLLAALLLAPTLARAQTPTPADMQQASAGTLADLGSLVVNLRAQLLADQREIAELQKQFADVRKTAETPKP